MNRNGENVSYLAPVLDFFSFLTIGMCLVAKVPQIRHLIRLKNANGISGHGLLMELFRCILHGKVFVKFTPLILLGCQKLSHFSRNLF